jgi:hypothetical protein
VGKSEAHYSLILVAKALFFVKVIGIVCIVLLHGKTLLHPRLNHAKGAIVLLYTFLM